MMLEILTQLQSEAMTSGVCVEQHVLVLIFFIFLQF